VPEPSNRYDPNAVQVMIEGKVVGYLSRRNAAILLMIVASVRSA